jgi:hypothetical protein
MIEAERAKKPRRYIARYAGEAFLHLGSPADGPMARRLTSEVAWKRPPSSDVRSEVSA